MAALLIPSGTQADGSKGAQLHVVGVFFMGLDVAAVFCVNVFAVIQLFSGHHETWGQGGRNAISMWESVQPEDCIANQPDNDESGDALEWERIACTTNSIFDGADAPFDVGDVFIL